jgi:hypothetical protein
MNLKISHKPLVGRLKNSIGITIIKNIHLKYTQYVIKLPYQKKLLMKRFYKNLFFTLLLITVFETVSAQLIFREDFNYPAGNLESANGGTGFTTAWSKNGTSSALGADSKAQIVSGSISPTGLGNKAVLCLEEGKNVRLDRTLPVTLNGPDGTNYWLGFWYRSNTDTAKNTASIGAQLILMSPAYNFANGNVAQRLQFGKHAVNSVDNRMNFASRSEGCTTTGTGSVISWGAGANFSPKGTYYILTKITKGDSTDAMGVKRDIVRMWLLDAPPANEAALASTPNGNTMFGKVALRSLRADNTSFCKADGITGLRIRVESGAATGNNTSFCVEFDDIRLGLSLASVLSNATPTKEVADNLFTYELLPNPAQNFSTLKVQMAKAGSAAIDVIDMTGKKVVSVLNGQLNAGGHDINIILDELSSGAYIVRMNMGGVQKSTKLFVTK